VLSIRRFRHQGLDLAGLAREGTFPSSLVPLARACVASRLNILISGGTGAGKSTFLNALSEGIGDGERVVTIEDAAELRLRQRHVVRLETRVADSADRKDVTARSLLRNALRMRPDRILVGEVRGPEALEMLQAMNSGHSGSMSTVHASSPRDALDRLEVMMSMADVNLSERSIRRQLARAVDLIVHLERLADGRRVVRQITEVGTLQGDMVALQDLFRFEEAEQRGEGLQGTFMATGIRPNLVERLDQAGYQPAADLWRLRVGVA
jgi:pilus assembly protein CpaF